jgi:general secretion pathway protein L
MATMSELKDLFSEWIATVARAVDTIAGRFLRSGQILLREGKDDMVVAKAISMRNAPALPEVSFRLDKGGPTPPLPEDWKAAFRGSRVEAVLQSDHVMFSPLDFPSQAGDFLDGMLREQVDRLTPWTVKQAIFGWSQPTDTANDRIEVTFAATSKLKIQPLLQLAQALDVRSIAVFATASGSEGTPTRIKLFDESLLSAIGRTVSVPRILRTILLSAGLAAAASLLVAAYLGSSLQSEQQELQRRVSQRRAALRLDPNAGGSSALSLLAKRKQTTPSSVLVLEAVSRVLPDSTYVTELRIEGDKVQVVGMTQDAPSLIRLMEQSPQFTRATFFAPTTHAQNEPGERFHIEAHITAYFGSGT